MKTKKGSRFSREEGKGRNNKDNIPKALREQVWIAHMGRRFDGKCPVVWCENRISVFDFQSGHNVPESHGGQTDMSNLIPICSRCNMSMGNQYTIDEWNSKFESKDSAWKLFIKGVFTSCCRF